MSESAVPVALKILESNYLLISVADTDFITRDINLSSWTVASINNPNTTLAVINSSPPGISLSSAALGDFLKSMAINISVNAMQAYSVPFGPPTLISIVTAGTTITMIIDVGDGTTYTDVFTPTSFTITHSADPTNPITIIIAGYTVVEDAGYYTFTFNAITPTAANGASYYSSGVGSVAEIPDNSYVGAGVIPYLTYWNSEGSYTTNNFTFDTKSSDISSWTISAASVNLPMANGDMISITPTGTPGKVGDLNTATVAHTIFSELARTRTMAGVNFLSGSISAGGGLTALLDNSSLKVMLQGTPDLVFAVQDIIWQKEFSWAEKRIADIGYRVREASSTARVVSSHYSGGIVVTGVTAAGQPKGAYNSSFLSIVWFDTGTDRFKITTAAAAATYGLELIAAQSADVDIIEQSVLAVIPHGFYQHVWGVSYGISWRQTSIKTANKYTKTKRVRISNNVLSRAWYNSVTADVYTIVQSVLPAFTGIYPFTNTQTLYLARNAITIGTLNVGTSTFTGFGLGTFSNWYAGTFGGQMEFSTGTLSGAGGPNSTNPNFTGTFTYETDPSVYLNAIIAANTGYVDLLDSTITVANAVGQFLNNAAIQTLLGYAGGYVSHILTPSGAAVNIAITCVNWSISFNLSFSVSSNLVIAHDVVKTTVSIPRCEAILACGWGPESYLQQIDNELVLPDPPYDPGNISVVELDTLCSIDAPNKQVFSWAYFYDSPPYGPINTPTSFTILIGTTAYSLTSPPDFPTGKFNIQFGEFAPIYPTYLGAFLYDISLQKWGKLTMPYRALLDFAPINTQSSQLLPNARFGPVGGILNAAGKIFQWDANPSDSFIVYGKFSLYRLGVTTIEEIEAQFGIQSTGTLETETSLDGKTVELSLSTSYAFTGARVVKAPVSKTGKWHNIVFRGQYDLTYLQVNGYRAGRR